MLHPGPRRQLRQFMVSAMTKLKSDLMRAYIDRGYMHQCTDQAALDELAATECVVAYIGFDCTASSFHVGNLVQIMMLRVLQRHGHKPIVLMGDGPGQPCL